MLQPLQAGESEKLLSVVTLIMNFTQRCYRDIEQGNFAINYSEQEFPFPGRVKYYIKSLINENKDTYLIDVYLSILPNPGRIDALIEAFMTSFKNQSYNDLNVMEWTVMCCIISAVLHDRGFIEAPAIAIESIRGTCILYNRVDAFRRVGFVI